MKKIAAFSLLTIMFALSCKKDKNAGPAVLTESATGVSLSGAALAAEITGFDNTQISNYGFVWSQSPAPAIGTADVKSFGASAVAPKTVNFYVTGLKAGTNYYYRAFVATVSGITYGNEISFTTIPSQWQQAGTFPGAGRTVAATFSIGNKAYVCTGSGGTVNNTTSKYSDVWEFDAATTLWTQKANFPGESRAAAAGFSLAGRGYIVSGMCGCNDCWQYNPANDSWIKKANFPATGVYFASTFTIGNKAYLGTGSNGMNLLTDFWEYDADTDHWTKKADFPGQAIDDGVGFSISGKGYFTTGQAVSGEGKALWQYDPALNTWTQKKEYPKMTFGAIGFTVNNKGYVGFGSGTDLIYSYDPSTDEWTLIENFPSPSRGNASAWVINNTAYIGFGITNQSAYPTDIWKFTPIN